MFEIGHPINVTSKQLQSVEIDFTIVTELYKVLIHFIVETRDKFDHLEKEAKELSFVQ